LPHQYNTRLQPSLISAASPSATLLSLTYNYGLGTNDNGNVLAITNNKNTSRSQTFTYTTDGLNRLAKAVSGTTWGVQFSYDAWGNLYSATGVTGTTYVAMTVNQTGINNKNQFTQGGYGYDATGNVLNDGLASGCGTSGYQWNAEGQMSCANGTTYAYDGDGQRVKKSSGTLYWAGGVAESDSSGNITSEYVFFGGARIARRDIATGNVYFYLSDHLGSSNVVTNATGVIQNESDFYPFGGERQITNNLTNQHFKFTGKERDSESGNDYFSARYYSNNMGRFISPDPISGNVYNPQSLNRYVYVQNSPLIATDPTGMIVSWEDSKAKCKKGELNCKTKAQREYEDKIAKLQASKNDKERAKGDALQATYNKLQASDINFHVVSSDPGGISSGELEYRGEPGNLYIDLKGDASANGALTNNQKIGHEFEHGSQFLDGLIGFTNNNGKWEGYRDDLVDEANAFIAGFNAEPVQSNQGKFLNDIQSAANNGGTNAVVNVLSREGPYRGRSTVEIPITTITPSIYAVPHK
jgi:RHS repeat-associated protein